MRLRCGLMVVFHLAASSALFGGEPAASRVRVEVSESETSAGWLYRYRIVNDSTYEVCYLIIGDREGGNAGLTGEPVAIASPVGWRGVFAVSEDAPSPVVMWQVSERLDAASRVAAAASLGDLNLIFPVRCSECTRLPFEACVVNAGSMGGTVELVAADPSATPLVVSIDQPVDEQILVGLTTLEATGSDPSSIVSLRFESDGSPMSGGTPVSSEITAPFFVSTWDTRTAKDGNRLLVAVATDAEGRTTRSAEVGATVVNGPANQPPTVSAGPDQTVTLPNPAALDGTARDDGLPTPPGAVTTTWSVVSGPGTVTFDNANAVDATVTFSAPGSYVLRLIANDGALSASDDVTVTVNSQVPLSGIKRGTIHSSTDASSYSFPSIRENGLGTGMGTVMPCPW